MGYKSPFKNINKDPMDLNDKKTLITKALLEYNINNNIYVFSDDEIVALCKMMGHSIFSDRTIISEELIIKNIDWNEIELKRVIRLLSRAMDHGCDDYIFNSIDFKNKKIPVSNLKSVLIRKPELIDTFNVDLAKISASEAYSLLSLGKEFFWSRINVKDHVFSSLEQFNIVKAYNYDIGVIKEFDKRKFDGFQNRMMMINIDVKHYKSVISIGKLTPLDWVELIKNKPETYSLCSIKNLEKARNIMDLIDIAVLTDDQQVFDIILKRDMRDISAFGWEKLVIARPQDFFMHCDVSKLGYHNRYNIMINHPDLSYLFMNL